MEDIEVEKGREYVNFEYFFLVSVVEIEYNIMKFYSFSINMVFNIFNDMIVIVEYFFWVGEFEYVVIDFNFRLLEFIIFIG